MFIGFVVCRGLFKLLETMEIGGRTYMARIKTEIFSMHPSPPRTQEYHRFGLTKTGMEVGK